MSITFDNINTLCKEVVVPALKNNIFQSKPLIYRLMKKPKKWEGEYYYVPIEYAANSNAESYGSGATLTSAAIEHYTKAKFEAKRYNVAVRLEGIDRAYNDGAGKLLDLVKTEMKSAETSLRDKFGTDIFTGGDSTTELVGLNKILGDTAGDTLYAGITKADAAQWMSSSYSTGQAGGTNGDTTTLTPAILAKFFNACKVDNDKPTLIVTTDDILAGVEALILQPWQRYAKASEAEFGFEHIKYKSAIMISDSACAANNMYMLNEKHLYFATLANFDFIPFVKEVAKDQTVAHVRWYGNIVCDSRRLQGRMSLITAVAAS